VGVKTQQKEIQAATLELGSYMCSCLRVASVTKCTSIEQIEADITEAREVLANAWTEIDKIRKELKSLADKVAKSKVRDTSRTDPWYKILRTYSTGLSVVFRRLNIKLRELDEVIKAKEQAASDCGGRDQEARSRGPGSGILTLTIDL
jgi:uncharacterized coiled-coil protein SlyX